MYGLEPNLGTGTTFLSEFSAEISGNIFPVIYFNVTELYSDLNESYYIAGLFVTKEVHETEKLLHLITEYFVERM